MAGSDSDDLDDLLLEAGGAGRPTNKRSRVTSISDDSGPEASQHSEEVSQEYQAPARTSKAASKKRKTDNDNKPDDQEDDFDPDTFIFDGYGKDLIRDSADKAAVDQLTEFEREQEFFQRAEARDRELERRNNARLMQQSRAKQAPVQTEVQHCYPAISSPLLCPLKATTSRDMKAQGMSGYITPSKWSALLLLLCSFHFHFPA